MFAINLSADGCYDHTRFAPEEDLMDYFTNLMMEVDQLIYGRKTYELMFPYWSDVAAQQSGSNADNEFGQTLTNIERIVFSNTLEESSEGRTRIMHGNPEDEIRRLKQVPGKKISVSGMTLLPRLLELGLVDEFRFVIHPVIVGQGARLFDNIPLHNNTNLELADSRVFKGGCIALHYCKK